MGLTRVQEYAKVAGATYKMGNKVLVNTDIFKAYLEQFRIPGDHEGMAKAKVKQRKDNKGRVLQKGESQRKLDGMYIYTYVDP